MLPCDAAGWRCAALALLRRLFARFLALLSSLAAASPPPAAPQPSPPGEAVEPREAAFCASAAGSAYGYAGRLAQLRAADFSRLRGTAYLDHAGAALYGETQVADVARALAGAVLGNPRACPSPRTLRACSAARAPAPQRGTAQRTTSRCVRAVAARVL